MTQIRPFSKLKKQIENLFVPELKMELCCISYPVRSQYGGSSIPRFYIRLDKKYIWDFPKDFPIKEISYHYWKDNTIISELIREYIDTPIKELPEKEFELEQNCGVHKYSAESVEDELPAFNLHLTDLLKAADRRIGKEKLLKWSKEKSNENVRLILEKRFGTNTTEL